ncbi:MAG: hypothetical protein ACRDK9_10600 [Solirubrobacterales bacterium]
MDEAFLIRCYLWAPGAPWSEEVTERLLEDLASFFAEGGFGNLDDSDEELRSVIVAGTVEVPEAGEWVEQLMGDPATGVIVIPRSG